MVIRTRYNIGDTVWFIRGDKIRSSKINNIAYSTNGKFHTLSYQLTGYSETLNPLNFQENQLFETKQELIESL